MVDPGASLEFYEREDGELGLIDDWDQDENTTYLLRRLRDVAERFRRTFENAAEFDAFFPAISVRTDMTAPLVTRRPLSNLGCSVEAGKQDARRM